jgi:hypothetical protein
LYIKALSVAQYLVQEILKHSTDNSKPEVQGSKEHRSGINPKRLSRRKQLDLTYQLPKSSRAQVDIYRGRTEDSYRASSSSSLVGNDSVICQPGYNDMTINQSSNSLVTEKPLPDYRNIPEIAAKEALQEGVQSQSSAYGCSMLSIDSKSVLYQLKVTYSSDSSKMNPVYRQLPVALNKSTEGREITVRSPLASRAEQQETALPEIDRKVSNDQATLQEITLPGPTLSIPV